MSPTFNELNECRQSESESDSEDGVPVIIYKHPERRLTRGGPQNVLIVSPARAQACNSQIDARREGARGSGCSAQTGKRRFKTQEQEMLPANHWPSPHVSGIGHLFFSVQPAVLHPFRARCLELGILSC